ncbi:hypothetical protein [Alkalibaculum bacchi]|uniref:hypothetical protein n=1 Tax=Alkalibaculum bacchi TaxID=645887 RepID=UPI001FA91390|nr:hypothetical protein [Alkalibaculum bacchi]
MYKLKVIAKEIEMIAWFKKMDMPIPIKFRFLQGDQRQVVKIDRILQADEEKLAGNRMYIYRCQSVIKNEEKIYELKYEVDKCRWYLFKI